jgi:hypothetical protein
LKHSPTQLVGATFAFAAFSVAIVSGLLGGNSATGTVFRAIVAMAVCYIVGSIVGMVCEYVIRTHVDAMNASQSVEFGAAIGRSGATPVGAAPEEPTISA